MRWFAPAEALELHRAGELLLVFPTIKQLEMLARFASPEEALRRSARSRSSRSCPASTRAAPEPRVLLPGDPDY